MCNLYSITTNQEAIIRLFRKVNRYVGNLAPMTGVFPDYPALVIRDTDTDSGWEVAMMRWGIVREMHGSINSMCFGAPLNSSRETMTPSVSQIPMPTTIEGHP